MKPWAAILLITALLCSSSVIAAGRLRVQLKPASHSAQLPEQVVPAHVIAHNDGDQAVELIDQSFPRLNRQGLMMNNVLSLRDASGREAPYRGIYVNLENAPEDDYLTIAPGQRLVITVDLQRNYTLAPGQTYTVSLRSPVLHLNRPRAAFADSSRDALRAALQQATANSVQVYVQQAGPTQAAGAPARP
ncbi:hypothetical protein [Xanthomonas campestris]|uniref:hypothetical protein n=1 Tax=Xanthomonas campestris TaxID=339 RepID=UPI00096F2B5F|nr:hypothetical protein [Xanthomonas campestris]MEA9482048.1 hypothetical protein [Xanthomonas campestris]WDJ89895.1 hypothetical protein JH302_00320 [Xanthomonas campestris]WDK00580.1 hypothetical protein JH273_11835 [Xanthomonas campestris]WHO92785.1 hypothetical protein QMY62_00225 [Xanthomonas campestris]WVL60928.1 hypothetical protein LLE68_000325 [Xanthomonas campestris pv. barbareae]